MDLVILLMKERDRPYKKDSIKQQKNKTNLLVGHHFTDPLHRMLTLVCFKESKSRWALILHQSVLALGSFYVPRGTTS